MIAEVKAALTTLALDPNGKPDAALLEGAGRPGAGPPVGGRRGPGQGRRAGRPARRQEALADKDLSVRQAAAAALTVAGEKDAVPVLIDLLGRAAAGPDVAGPGRAAPARRRQGPDRRCTGDKPEERKKYRDAWADWWKANGHVRRPGQADHGARATWGTRWSSRSGTTATAGWPRSAGTARSAGRSAT